MNPKHEHAQPEGDTVGSLGSDPDGTGGQTNRGTSKKKRKRRWLRYSLRTFFLLVTVFAVWLGLLVHWVNKQMAAVEWVEEHGGVVWYDFQMYDGGVLKFTDELPGPDWLRDLVGLDYFANVIGVHIDGALIDDLKPLEGFPNLRWIYLFNQPPRDLRQLLAMKDVKVFTIFWTGHHRMALPQELQSRTEHNFHIVSPRDH